MIVNRAIGVGCTRSSIDGYRIVTRKQRERVTLWTRHGTNFTDRLPKIGEAVRGLTADQALLDGEAVVFRPDGLSDFAALRTKAGGAEACLVAFDLLNLDGEDLRQLQLEDRRDGLRGWSAAPTLSSSAGRSSRGRDRVRARLQARPRRDRVEADRRPVLERKQPTAG